MATLALATRDKEPSLKFFKLSCLRETSTILQLSISSSKKRIHRVISEQRCLI